MFEVSKDWWDYLSGDRSDRMKKLYNALRFLFACALIFWSGYSVAKPRHDADKVFAPFLCSMAIYSLWRNSGNRIVPN